jgi:hypothetical protein
MFFQVIAIVSNLVEQLVRYVTHGGGGAILAHSIS